MKIEDFIMLIKSSEVNAHIYHWVEESSGFRHEIIGKYYESIGELLDALVETAQGKFGLRYSLKTDIVISDLSVLTYFANLSHQVTIMVDVLFKEYKDLENIALEILAEINKLRYLLSLS